MPQWCSLPLTRIIREENDTICSSVADIYALLCVFKMFKLSKQRCVRVKVSDTFLDHNKHIWCRHAMSQGKVRKWVMECERPCNLFSFVVFFEMSEYPQTHSKAYITYLKKPPLYVTTSIPVTKNKMEKYNFRL